MGPLLKRCISARRLWHRAEANLKRINAQTNRLNGLCAGMNAENDYPESVVLASDTLTDKLIAAEIKNDSARREYKRALRTFRARTCGVCRAHVGNNGNACDTTQDGYSTLTCQALVARRACLRYK
jgi:hypothetical protein